jgi:polysaccharide biosynthesis protein PslH
VRVLIVVDEPPLPPPYNGGRLALDGVFGALREEHEVRVVALDGPRTRPDPDWLRIVPGPPPGVVEWGRRWGRFARGRPLRADALIRALRPTVEREIADFDPEVVHLFSDQLASLRPVIGARGAVLSALDATHLNVLAQARRRRGPARWALRLQADRVRRHAADELPAFDAVVLVTPQDADAVRAENPRIETRVIPNGVHTGPFAGLWVGTARHRLTLHGAMHWSPNVDAAVFAAEEVLPRVRRRIPDAELALVGRDPAPEVRDLAQLPGVVVTGEVDDVAPWLHATGVYLCPMRQGTGIKNKLLEAMAAGAPCVATPLAMQGIAAVAGEDVLVGEEAEKLAEHVVRVLGDRQLAEQLGSRGRACVTARHSWAASAQAYLDLYGEAAEHGAARRSSPRRQGGSPTG